MIIKRDYFANVDGIENEYKLSVSECEPGCYEVNIDGVNHKVDFQKITENIYSIIIDNKSYSIDITENGDIFDVLVNGDFFKIEVLDEMKRLMKKRTSSSIEGRQVIEAQMPGYIWKILVDKGAEVKAGQPLMILVAMKMENEIKSPKDGIVEELFVKLDQTVNIGDKLAVVE